MVAIKRILCPVDLSELSIRALVFASDIAEWYSSELSILHVVPTFEPMEVRAGELFNPVQFVYPMTPDQIEERLRDAGRAAGFSLDRARIIARAGNPTDVIVNEALTRETDLVVMATHGRKGWDRLMLGSFAERVLHRARCSVLTVPPPAGALANTDPPILPRMTLRTVLCAVDFSPGSLHAADFAMDLAMRSEASLTLLHVIEWLAEENVGDTADFAVPEFRQVLIQNAREQLEALAAPASHVDVEVTVNVTAGRAYRQIASAAFETGADVIVLGAHGRGGPPLEAVGSTADQVVRAAPCPILTVRPRGGDA